MKNFSVAALVLAAAFTATVAASAQESQARAKVPFAFTVGASNVPAGTYVISSKNISPNLLSLTNSDSRVSIMIMGQPLDSSAAGAGKLVFQKYGDKYFLRDIVSPNTSTEIHFAESKAEKTARTQEQTAGKLVDDPILIALK